MHVYLVYYLVYGMVYGTCTMYNVKCTMYNVDLVDSVAGPLVSITIKLTPLLNHHFGFGPSVWFFHISKMMRVIISVNIIVLY